MILVDTSVLIDFLKGEDNPAVQKFVQVIEREIPFGISPSIFLEVLQGAATDKDFKLLREYLRSQAFYDLKDGRESIARAARMSFELRRMGMAAGNSIDLLIAQTAIDNDLYLLHNDSDFDRIKQVSRLKTWD
ncbi:MAG: PIN domain-containing protein [Candidatus Aminicenantes bacterium]|nr:PIN domain-containing protein [Candidatus Aminicenantes bacterium]